MIPSSHVFLKPVQFLSSLIFGIQKTESKFSFILLCYYQIKTF